MDFTQADIDSLAHKLDALTDGEKAALAAAIEQQASDEVAGFQFEKGAPTALDFGKLEHRLFGTTYGGDGFTAPGDVAG
jgi:hypothetical protein